MITALAEKVIKFNARPRLRSGVLHFGPRSCRAVALGRPSGKKILDFTLDETNGISA